MTWLTKVLENYFWLILAIEVLIILPLSLFILNVMQSRGDIKLDMRYFLAVMLMVIGATVYFGGGLSSAWGAVVAVGATVGAVVLGVVLTLAVFLWAMGKKR